MSVYGVYVVYGVVCVCLHLIVGSEVNFRYFLQAASISRFETNCPSFI